MSLPIYHIISFILYNSLNFKFIYVKLRHILLILYKLCLYLYIKRSLKNMAKIVIVEKSTDILKNIT